MLTHFTQLDAWKVGHQLVIKVYEKTETFPNRERFGITSQIRRASNSITANLAEGFGRYHPKDKIRFYIQARGSCYEVQNFILISYSLKYLHVNDRNDLLKIAESATKLCNALITSVRRNHQIGG